VAGDVDHERLVKLVRKEYGGWERGKGSVDIPVEPAQKETERADLKWPLPTLPIVYLGFHIPATDPKNADTAALGALAQAVFGETSPLYKQLVLDEQKVVLLQADAENKRDPGLFTVVARIRDSKDVAAVRERMEAALGEAAKSPIDTERLAAIKDHLRYSFAGGLVSADAVAHAIGESIATTGQVDMWNDLYAAYDKLTPADLARVASRYFSKTNETIVTLASEDSK